MFFVVNIFTKNIACVSNRKAILIFYIIILITLIIYVYNLVLVIFLLLNQNHFFKNFQNFMNELALKVYLIFLWGFYLIFMEFRNFFIVNHRNYIHLKSLSFGNHLFTNPLIVLICLNKNCILHLNLLYRLKLQLCQNLSY